MKTTPVLLLILDGFGHREAVEDNAVAQARTPNLDALKHRYPHTLINASEHFVGLPDGQMGNSEVGHINIGSGRVVYQDLERINLAIHHGEFFQHPGLTDLIDRLKANGRALHILGLLSDGGVHSHQDHIHAMIKMAVERGLEKVYVHAFLDGRDTPPVSAEGYIRRLENTCATVGGGTVASICGRFYAMDRDKRWPRVEAAYDLLTEGISEFRAESALEALHAAYARNENDEFVKPTGIAPAGQKPPHIEDGDGLVFMNFRSDRARQLTHALLAEHGHFDGFHRRHVRKFAGYFTLTQHDKNEAQAVPIFEPTSVHNTFGEYLSKLGLTQLRIAETEKYPHVTFFFNGGEEQVFKGEDRILVPSPQVATYDLQPEMSAREVTDDLKDAILSGKYNAIICNYANCDMVGHTGNLQAAIKAVETLDTCIGELVEALQSMGGEMIITADHGNAEQMQDKANNQPHTQHTTNLVPFIYVGRPATLADTGALSDIAPSLLAMMGLEQPAEMTGHSLIRFQTNTQSAHAA